ncbi:MAG TPA: iron permease, partial [Symbiobacteriaceae bacterium]|nr:iron permease [Symbiobacteriaceae bacterium]
VAVLRIGLKIPMRPFFLVSSVLVFYLGFKFTGMGIHGLQLAGVLPATVVPYLPHFDFLALYPNWQSTLPQLLLLAAAGYMILRSRSASSKT